MKIARLAVVLLCGLMGCGGEEPEPAPPPPPSPAVVAAVAGGYGLTSAFDVPASALLPGPAGDALTTLRNLRQNPASTLFALVDQAGVPLGSELHDALPGLLKGRLDGWINDFVIETVFRDHPAAAQLDAIATTGQSLLLHFELLSDLDLGTSDATGASTATHTLRAVRFNGMPGFGVLTVPALPPALAAGTTLARLPLRLAAAGNDARLLAGDHAFGLAIGRYAAVALDLALQEAYGQDLRGTLGLLVSCPAMAASVAHRCVGPVCVGHEGALQAVCERGLDEVASEVRSHLMAQNFKALHLLSGSAALSVAGRIDAGTWHANIDVGQGEHPVSAVFAGLRQ
jgi:hypothetical protein